MRIHISEFLVTRILLNQVYLNDFFVLLLSIPRTLKWYKLVLLEVPLHIEIIKKSSLLDMTTVSLSKLALEIEGNMLPSL